MSPRVRCRALLATIFVVVPYALACTEPPQFDWPGSRTGECYPSTDAYITTEYPWTAGGRLDDIIVKRASPRTDMYVWVLDNTAEVNISGVLLELNQDRVCVILSAIHASDIRYEFGLDGSLPAQVITESTPPPGFPAIRVTYTLDRTTLQYHPSTCYGILENAATLLNCATAFTD